MDAETASGICGPDVHFSGFVLCGLASEIGLIWTTTDDSIWVIHIFYERSGDNQMAEKLPVIIDNRGDNSLLYALRRLLPNLRRMDIGTGAFEIGSLLLLEGLWQELANIHPRHVEWSSANG